MLLNGCGSGDSVVLEEIVEQVYPVEPDTNITVQNRDGAVMVYGSYAKELRVRAVKKAYSRDRLSQITIEVSRTPGTVSVITKFPPQANWTLSDRSGTVDYTITVPATASISKLDLHAGEVLLNGMRGKEVHAQLGDGRIFAHNCFTNLDVTMNRGTLMLSYGWWEKEKFSTQINVGQGNAWVWLPSDAAFHLLCEATHGTIANDFNDLPVSNNPAAAGAKIDQMVNGGGAATIQIRVDKGNIKISEANP
ncbi:MAG TPA: DUF4097 family beta strand repeat-containing protein [Candidatus Udaeobacter sp.]|jgi:hypothetical protein